MNYIKGVIVVPRRKKDMEIVNQLSIGKLTFLGLDKNPEMLENLLKKNHNKDGNYISFAHLNNIRLHLNSSALNIGTHEEKVRNMLYNFCRKYYVASFEKNNIWNFFIYLNNKSFNLDNVTTSMKQAHSDYNMRAFNLINQVISFTDGNGKILTSDENNLSLEDINFDSIDLFKYHYYSFTFFNEDLKSLHLMKEKLLPLFNTYGHSLYNAFMIYNFYECKSAQEALIYEKRRETLIYKNS